MVKDAPHITLTMGRDADGEKTTGDIGTLGLGFGVFQAWLYMAVFCVIRIFEPSDFTGFNFYLPESMANSILYTFLASSAVTLIFIGASNQRYLRFYVSKLAMWLGAGLCSAGTLVAFLACTPYSPDIAASLNTVLTDAVSNDTLSLEGSFAEGGLALELLFDGQTSPLSIAASIVSGTFMGVGSSLLVALWGTGFARSRFTTIVLNAAFSIPLGVIVAFLLIIWLPSPIAGIITACLPFFAILFLGTLTPMPFYQRHEKPIFDPFPAHKTSYIVRIGIPTVIMGVVLGALRIICAGEVLPSGSITIQLVLGAACALGIVVFVAAIAISRRNPYWDTLFRSIIPVIVIGSVSIPFVFGEYAVPAAFLVSLGYICLEVLMWVFFADLSNRFSLSPLFVFGIGRGILEIAGILGSALALWAFHDTYMEIGGLTLLALICATLTSVGYSVLPRYREFKGIIEENGDPGASTAHAVIEPRTSSGKDTDGLDVDAREIAEAGGRVDGRVDGRVNGRDALTSNEMLEVSSALPGTSPSTSTSQFDDEVDPLLAVDGIAEESGQNAGGSSPSVQQNVTPLGTDAIASETASTEIGDESEAGHEKGSFYRRCDEISDRYILSKREREVLPLLAKGHNAAFIQDKLCVSKSTAKTHINHIYKKLNIHTQQELLNMVEDRQRGPLAGGSDLDRLAFEVAGDQMGDASGLTGGLTGNPANDRREDRRVTGNNYMLDKNAYIKAVSEAASNAPESRPKPKRGYRTSIFGDR